MLTNKYVTYSKDGKILLPNIKKLFIPDIGMEMCDADLSGADIQVVASDSNCKWLQDFFSKPQEKKVYAHIASEFLQRDVSDTSSEYKTFKGIFHGCVTGEHEVLTRVGWIRIDEYNELTQELAVWDIKTSNISFEIPSGFNRDWVHSTEKLVAIEGSSYSQLTTQDHRFPYHTNGYFKVVEAINLPKGALLPYTGNYVGGSKVEAMDYMKLIAALQADGHIAHTSKEGVTTYTFRFVKQRKIERLESILTNLTVAKTCELSSNTQAFSGRTSLDITPGIPFSL